MIVKEVLPGIADIATAYLRAGASASAADELTNRMAATAVFSSQASQPILSLAFMLDRSIVFRAGDEAATWRDLPTPISMRGRQLLWSPESGLRSVELTSKKELASYDRGKWIAAIGIGVVAIAIWKLATEKKRKRR